MSILSSGPSYFTFHFWIPDENVGWESISNRKPVVVTDLKGKLPTDEGEADTEFDQELP